MPEKSAEKQSLRFCQGDGLYADLVRNRAYELYLERGMEDGHDVEDWLQAEGEINSQTESFREEVAA